MTKLFIHIGSHKTGTTSIQRACLRYLADSPAQNVKYFNLRPSGTKIVRSFGRLGDFRASVDLDAASMLLRPDPGNGSSPNNPSPRRYIASDEDFFWIGDPDSVHSMASTLKERFSSIEVICYLRRQDQLAVSHRKQVSEGSGMAAARFYGVSPTPLPQFQERFLGYFDYAAKLSDVWVSAFGKDNVTVIPFDRTELVNGDVVDDFARRVGVTFSPPDPVKVNSSLAGDKTLVGLKLAELGAPVWLRRKIMNALPGIGKFLPTRQEARDFLAHFDAANERLAGTWDWNGGPLRFSDAFDMYPEEEANWSNLGVEQILDAVLGSLLSNDGKALRRVKEGRSTEKGN